MTDLVACETVAAIVVHLRHVGAPIKLGGHAAPKPLSLCGKPIDWDTRLPLSSASCRRCIEAIGAAK